MATPRSGWSRPAVEGALVLVALLLMFAAATAGFVVGRETAGGEPAAAGETNGETETVATETAETETGETETGETETAETETAETETAEPETGETETGDDVSGEEVFAEAGCGSCHVFEPANATGTIGPSLDDTDLSQDEIEEQVREGGGGMPAFEDRLSDAEIEAVADFVESG